MLQKAIDPTPKSLIADRLQALLQMQKNRSLLQEKIQMFIKWKSTSAQN